MRTEAVCRGSLASREIQGKAVTSICSGKLVKSFLECSLANACEFECSVLTGAINCNQVINSSEHFRCRQNETRRRARALTKDVDVKFSAPVPGFRGKICFAKPQGSMNLHRIYFLTMAPLQSSMLSLGYAAS